MITIRKTPCPDTDIEVNGTPEGSVPAGSTLDIQLTDGTNPVTPDDVTLVGQTLTIEVPAGGGVLTRSTARLIKTGQTTSYATGDDGDIQAGRDNNFFTLKEVPLHDDGSSTINTTTNRFTDELGGQTYTNNIVLDWSTWDGERLLGISKGSHINNLVTWFDANINALAFVSGGFSVWRLPNDIELMSISYKGNSGVNPQVLQYPAPYNAVFNITSNVFWSGTSVGTTNSSLFLSTSNGSFTAQAHTLTRRALYVRDFFLSTSNVLT